MLEAKEIDSLPRGTYPNSYLRRKFGVKHGHVVKSRTVESKYRKNGQIITKDPEDVEFVGNRSQYNLSMRSPLRNKPFNSKLKNLLGRAKNEDGVFSRIIKALKKLFQYLFFQS